MHSWREIAYWLKMLQWFSCDTFSLIFSSLLRITRKEGLLFISAAQHSSVKLQNSHTKKDVISCLSNNNNSMTIVGVSIMF